MLFMSRVFSAGNDVYQTNEPAVTSHRTCSNKWSLFYTRKVDFYIYWSCNRTIDLIEFNISLHKVWRQVYPKYPKMSRFPDLTQLSIDDAMIWYAVRSRSTVYSEEGWKYFKLEYECPQTSAELFAKFWDEIMPNMNNYDVVTGNSSIADWLTCIPKPNDSTRHVPQLVSTDPRFFFKRQTDIPGNRVKISWAESLWFFFSALRRLVSQTSQYSHLFRQIFSRCYHPILHHIVLPKQTVSSFLITRSPILFSV